MTRQQKYEAATTRVSAGMMVNIAIVLGVAISDLFEGTPAAPVALPGHVRRRLEAAQQAIAAALEWAEQ